jgi:hypothetical protein
MFFTTVCLAQRFPTWALKRSRALLVLGAVGGIEKQVGNKNALEKIWPPNFLNKNLNIRLIIQIL